MSEQQYAPLPEEQDERPPARAIKDIEAEHPDEWVMFEVTKRNGFIALEGRLAAHGKDYREVEQQASAYYKKYNVKSFYSNYPGEMKIEAVILSPIVVIDETNLP